MVTVGDLCQEIESFAPLHYQESYDNSGLIVGDRTAVVTGVLIALDVTEAVLDEAIAGGFNFILTHHPIVFKGIRTLTGNTHTERCVVKAVRNHLNLYAGHTNVDAVRGGVNEKMAEKLGLEKVEILMPHESGGNYGLGMVGYLKSAVSEEVFLQQVKSAFHCTVLRHSQLTGQAIQRVAVCGGSGSEFLNDAVKAGAQAFVTGEAKYHEFFTEGREILLVDAGHYETEQFTKEVFFDLISKKLPTFGVRISEAGTNPVSYL